MRLLEFFRSVCRFPGRFRIFAFGAALFAAAELFYLAVDQRTVGLLLFEPFAEIVHFTADEQGFFLIGLRLADRADRLLDLPVGLRGDLLGLVLRFLDQAVPLGLNRFQFRAVFFGQLVHTLLGLSYFVALLLPIAPVARDLAQLPLDIDVVAAGLVRLHCG